MANELAEKKANLVSLMANNGLADVLQPLTREIHLFDSHVAGTSHLQDASVLDSIQKGDRLSLQREDNKFDGNAILILDQKGRKIGYVPARDNLVCARLMDAGKVLAAKIDSFEKKGAYARIGIGIYLIDF